jgi:hypothetical protein
MKISKSLIGMSLLSAGVLGLATYSNLSINSSDFMNDNEIKFVKRIDELNGKTVRNVASLKPFSLFGETKETVMPKIAKVQKTILRSFTAEAAVNLPTFGRGITKVVDPNCAEAVIKQELDLTLTEVYSPKKFQTALTKAQFDGSLNANNGVIDSLEARLPGNENVSMNNVKMCGNLFTYEISGEKYSGMIFTTDNKSFMVSLTEGPFDGTRFKFDVANATEEVVNNNNVDQPADAQEFAQVNENQDQVAQAPAQQPGFAPVAQAQQPAFNANNYQQQPQMQGEEMAELSQEEIEGQTQNQGFNFNNSGVDVPMPEATEAQI